MRQMRSIWIFTPRNHTLKGTTMFEHDEDKEINREMKRNLLNLARMARKKLLKEENPEEAVGEHPLERMAARITFAFAENQDQAEQEFGEDFLLEHSLSKGAFTWLSEPDMDQGVMIMLGVIMSICDTQIMIDLAKDLGLNSEIHMEFAQSQIDHIKRHQRESEEHTNQLRIEMTPESVLNEVESLLIQTCNHCNGPLVKNNQGDLICKDPTCFFHSS